MSLKTTFASVALAGMSLFGGLKTAKAEEYTPAEQEKIIEMAKVLEKKTVNYTYKNQAAELLKVQKELPEMLKMLEEKNKDLDFSKHPKLGLMKTKDGMIYLKVGEKNDAIYRVHENGRCDLTEMESDAFGNTVDSTTINIDNAKKTFSMQWIHGDNETESPTISFGNQKAQTKTLATGIKKFKTL